jgi:uncharacterized protein (TIGR00661 family)
MSKINSNQDYTRKEGGKPRILLAPLDWGLGHTTRCIPVIYELLAQNADVWLAGERAQEALFSKEFPLLPFLTLEGYRVKYGSSSTGLIRTLFFQVPRLLRIIKKENQWLDKVVKEHQFDAVISDNRFGLYHSSIPSVFITHQLFIKSPMGKWAASFLQRKNYKFINHFTQCWVPDYEGSINLAGELSHPEKKPRIPLHYIGPLSRLRKIGEAEKKGHLFISLSGPEPQRTLLENMIIDQVSHYNDTATIVRGLPAQVSIIPSTNDIQFYNHLPAAEYNKEIEKAEYVISRSGYSTIMDLTALGKKSILIPTPGQTEQEYLGELLMQQKKAYCISQDKFSLPGALQAAEQFKYASWSTSKPGLAETISALLKSI